jgi:hypothetical protein
MYPLFAEWLEENVDFYTEQLLIPATACFDFIAIKGEHVIVYELKLRDAKKVIRQANVAHLWSDHSWVVMPKKTVHLAMQRRHHLKPCSGIMSLDMRDGTVQIELHPTKTASHVTVYGLRKAMQNRIIKDIINKHQKYIATWKTTSFMMRQSQDRVDGDIAEIGDFGKR